MRALGEEAICGRRISCEETDRISMTITRMKTYALAFDDGRFELTRAVNGVG